MSIEINNESNMAVDETQILRLATHVLDQMFIHPDADLSVVFVDVGPMEELHVQWMDEPGPTDVLSFPMDELRPGSIERQTPPGLLGDIVLCPQVAQSQAEAAGHSTVDEVLLLVTHGILHLLGFDHADPEEHKEMFGLQRDLLLSFAVAERKAGFRK
ncbi:MAG: rRNA maturation RNase YbeY [Gulosibacter sp.]|uniref:rRNA maturation RNase YbeY n=1 Tax=Gulosibacter sp. TaxID=2817531 RepID=UPI003F92310D